MVGKSQYHTSLAGVAGPGAGATISWEFDAGSSNAVSQPVADADGNIYFGAADGSSGKLVKLNKNGVKTRRLYKIHERKSPNILDFFQRGKIDLAINISDSHFKKVINDDYVIRRSAIDHNIPLFTNFKKAELFIKAIVEKKPETLFPKSWNEYVRL